MTAINRLSKLDSLKKSDLLAVEDDGEREKASLGDMMDWLTSNFTPPRLPRRIYERQAVTVSEGDAVSMSDTENDLWLILQTENAATLAAASLIFPLAPVEQQYIFIQWIAGAVTALTHTPGAAGVTVLTAVTSASSAASTSMGMFVFDATRRFWISTS